MTDNASLRIEILLLPLCSKSATSILVRGFRRADLFWMPLVVENDKPNPHKTAQYGRKNA
jgi:hypothetical protein